MLHSKFMEYSTLKITVTGFTGWKRKKLKYIIYKKPENQTMHFKILHFN